MTAAVSVSQMAATASGSLMEATYTSQPFLKASTNTDTSGTNRNSDRKTSAVPISRRRTQAGSVVARATLGGARVSG